MKQPLLSARQRIVLALIFSLLSILFFLGRSAYLFADKVLPRNIETAEMQFAIFEMAAMLICALFMFPMLILNLRAWRGKDSPLLTIPPVRPAYAVALGVVWFFALCLGSLVSLIPEYGWTGIVPLLAPGVLLPLAFLVWMAAGGLLSTSQRRFWNVVGFGIAGSTALAMTGELLVLALGRLGGEWLWGEHPLWRNLMDNLSPQLESASTTDEILNALSPYLSTPWVLVSLLILAALLIPLIEEISKVAILFWMGSRLTSVGEGFALGAVCGAGFALVEGMLATGNTSLLWGAGALARLGSSVMHVTLSAVLGRAIAASFLEGHRGRWLGTYLLSSGLHGLWNGITVLAVYLSLQTIVLAPQFENNDLATAVQAMFNSLLVLLLLAVLLALCTAGIIALPWLNLRLRKSAQNQQVSSTVSEELLAAESPSSER